MPVTRTRWLNTNKGGQQKYNIRCRFVGRQLKAKTKEALVAHELFSAMPPWECVKTLLSLLATDDLPGLENEEL